ncbi:VWA domain-containing protein [Geminocystis sp. GBBB08]|uniref:VWA domain-containing protein n=1 Tax=Geminocystis sp. GBBB08 TaxID=2604140 RepID=UPI0027E3388F|nr:VWA domain-containing protein [Geminocystis sp. GBBB08]MBL1209785.1 VWA domain-containing protein [Geminocystis sp. GBBB08]
MAKNCDQITIGEALSDNQKLGLELVSRLTGGRDVVFAVDLTESVSLDAQGKVRLKQIVQDSLNKGDRVYIVPFSSRINPTNANVNPLSLSEVIEFKNPQEDIDLIIDKIPLQANIREKNTDIQQAEHFIYRNLAQINQNRLCSKQPIKYQSVVWLTDAPLNTKSGITSDIWIETPKESPYRNPNSSESIDRQNWLNHLPINLRSLNIENYQLSIADIKPTVQEFCTPAPEGKETCLINSYITNQLWLPITILLLISIIILGGGILALKYYLSLQKTWKLEIELPNDDQQIRFLKNKNSLAIGEEIECLGGEIRGYLKREGNQIIIEPNNILPIIYKGKEIKQKQVINGNIIRLNCPYNHRDFEIKITIK